MTIREDYVQAVTLLNHGLLFSMGAHESGRFKSRHEWEVATNRFLNGVPTPPTQVTAADGALSGSQSHCTCKVWQREGYDDKWETNPLCPIHGDRQ